MENIYNNIPDHLPRELFDGILSGRDFRMERIVSRGHKTPEGTWYDQDEDEWVLVLKGCAGLCIQGRKEVIVMGPGDYVHLDAHVKHRVEWTDEAGETVWLAIHFNK
jgi:cupin 2 domain-containing protein